MTNQPILDNGHLRLTFEGDGGLVSGFTLDVYADGQPHRMGALRPISHVVYRDKAGNRQEMAFAACVAEVAGDRVTLRQAQTDADGVSATLTATFAFTDDPSQIAVDYRLETSESRGLLHWIGPAIYAGEGSFGATKDEALFPGLEYLLDDEPSSDTRFAAEKYARRHIPHPYKITIPLMAVSHKGRGVGLMWDPNQDWHNAWRHPAAVFSSPNRLETSLIPPTPFSPLPGERRGSDSPLPSEGRGAGGVRFSPEGAANHLLALAAPSVDPRWRNDGELEAHAPASGKVATLSGRLTARPEGGVMGIVRAWVETYGLPVLPDVGDYLVGAWKDYGENVELCVKSFLDVAWDEAAEGWHHTLSDPWGPRYEPNLANLLWRYGRWEKGDPVLAGRARDQVRRGVARARAKDPASAPHLDLALVFGHAADALDALAAASQKALAEQQADGSWPWTPDAVHGGDLKTAERLAIMGKEQDSATGFTATKVRPVLQYALCTGNPEAVAAIRRAADWCNAQRRPEGAQTWELHLHVPDVLAAPYLINLNLGVYELTGDEAYLEAANRWAWTGLPFTYLWNGYYRPIMRYGTVPVFGVTFHDVQSWFGVIVQWNGLVYAEALFRLARRLPSDGRLDWRHLAEGITRHGIQEQMTYGPHLGMYPDAFSPVKGDEEYTWWLNPQLVGINSFPLADLPVIPEPAVLRDGSPAVHVTSGATLLEAERSPNGSVRLLLQDQPGEVSYTLVTLPDPPAEVACEGAALPAVADVDAVAEGWQWLDAHHVALVKVKCAKGIVTLSVK